METEAELDEYMHDVAGIVGYLITEVFSHFDRRIARRRQAMMGLAREYGLGLQTVNVIRGLRKDYARGWLFVPRRYLEELGLSPRQFLSPLHVERSMQVVRRLVEKAEHHLRDGLEYVLQIPRHLHRREACDQRGRFSLPPAPWPSVAITGTCCSPRRRCHARTSNGSCAER
ncbi:MAG: squalene/phytoene synthase family protein [Halomonas sp.]|uniref:squalene/phytoene synthase family protein n=1 Tax=Halomonas sp. TaxID=1486246 RepID=UPI002ACDBA87|nr:squalene/phytoene synthase family protein [Halomonas sp.]MDZ7852609.1 squalene/phytoene synthase family protein [Halomonas sp.]